MKTIAISAIATPANRQRRDFNAARLHELADNISRRGLLHPIILREDAAIRYLVAGERRLRAVKDLADLGVQINHDGGPVEIGSIPYTLLSDLSPLAAEEAELDENIHRDDLTWQERSRAHARLASLRNKQAEARGEPPPSTADLVAEIRGEPSEGLYQEGLRRELLIAKHLDKPEVAAAKSVDEAFKILKRSEESERNRSLGERVGRTFTADVHRAINADALSWLVDCPAESFDVILTDPPYGMGADEFGDSGGLAQGAHGYADDAALFQRVLVASREQLFRIAKPQAHLYFFCDIDNFHRLHIDLTTSGWQVFRTPLIWHKPSAMRAPWPEHGPQRKWECLLYAVKGKRRVTRMAADLMSYSPDTNLGHSAQKPVALFKDLLTRSVSPGDSVLDPFCGTGTIFPAAHELKCKATGIELDTASYGIAVKRIEQLKTQKEILL